MKLEERTTAPNGMGVLVLIHPMGFRCGYVGIDADHALFARHYYDPVTGPTVYGSNCPTGYGSIPETYDIVSAIDAPGSITYAGTDPHESVADSDLWWFGFDHGHAWDGFDPRLAESPHINFARIGSSLPVASKDQVVLECYELAEALGRFDIIEGTVAEDRLELGSGPYVPGSADEGGDD